MANLTHREYIKLHGDLTVERMEALIDLWELVENERSMITLAPDISVQFDDILDRMFLE